MQGEGGTFLKSSLFPHTPPTLKPIYRDTKVPPFPSKPPPFPNPAVPQDISSKNLFGKDSEKKFKKCGKKNLTVARQNVIVYAT